jgi:SAM-dependent methyltransferase
VQVADAEPAADACRICGNAAGNRAFVAREMMLGLRHRFDYSECGACGALQIRQIPTDLGPYYAPPYYSMERARPAGRAKRWLRGRIGAHALGRPDPVGWLLGGVGGAAALEGFKDHGVTRDARVLDVGAGAGQTLLMFHDFGFRRLLGVDPFISADIRYANGVEVRRAGIPDVEDRWDLLMFHHSFEHVPDPVETLAAARARLASGGRILIRTPVAAESWRAYGPDWVELDAPRHLHVHTRRSMEHLAESMGLRVLDVIPEPYAFELWGSEQYRRDIPLTDPRSHATGGQGTVFGRREMREFARRTRELARQGTSGRAAFWLAASD